jgi:hypothetical protein
MISILIPDVSAITRVRIRQEDQYVNRIIRNIKKNETSINNQAKFSNLNANKIVNAINKSENNKKQEIISNKNYEEKGEVNNNDDDKHATITSLQPPWLKKNNKKQEIISNNNYEEKVEMDDDDDDEHIITSLQPPSPKKKNNKLLRMSAKIMPVQLSFENELDNNNYRHIENIEDLNRKKKLKEILLKNKLKKGYYDDDEN